MLKNFKFIIFISVLTNSAFSQDLNISNLTISGNRLTFLGNSLEIYSPNQAQYNGNNPLINIGTWGEVNYYSRIGLNYNTLFLKNTTDFKNGLHFVDEFGTITGIGGPALYGENGGVLGTKKENWDGATSAALTWNKNN